MVSFTCAFEILVTYVSSIKSVNKESCAAPIVARANRGTPVDGACILPADCVELLEDMPAGAIWTMDHGDAHVKKQGLTAHRAKSVKQ